MLIRTPKKNISLPEGFPAYQSEFKNVYGWVYCIQILEPLLDRFKIGMTEGSFSEALQRVKSFKKNCKKPTATLFLSTSGHPRVIERVIKNAFIHKASYLEQKKYMVKCSTEIYILGSTDYSNLYKITKPTKPIKQIPINKKNSKPIVSI
jgi:hypothetical protein